MRVLTPLVLALGVITAASTALTQAAYTDPLPPTVKTASATATAEDDSPVILTGHICKNLGDEYYLFEDASGEVKVEIDNTIFEHLDVTATHVVSLKGEVDHELLGRDIEIDSVHVVTSHG